jgi:serine/threonine-protein kinase HipA
MTALSVHLRGERVGTLAKHDPDDGLYTFAYDPAVATREAGAPLLSVSLPCQPGVFETTAARPFFEGLLPEGEVRERIARDIKVSSPNSFELLARLGRDCAGAVVVLRDGEAPDAAAAVEWLDERELSELVDRLPIDPLGVSGPAKLRLSLAGLQRKAVLIRRSDGVFGKPTAAHPSTHIVKPQYGDSEYRDLVFNEHFCMRVAAETGLDTARTEIIEVGDRPCLLVTRFDRTTADGTTARVHQEDFCQALGVSPGLKYQAEGGPGLAAATNLLRNHTAAGGASVLTLLRATILNFVLGNGDAHAKNFALLHGDVLAMAPLYDIVSTAAYPGIDSSLAMSIGENADPDSLDGGDLFDLAEDCQLNYGELSREWKRFAAMTLRAAERVADIARDEGWHRPVVDDVVAIARSRATRID